MKKSKFTEDLVVRILQEAESAQASQAEIRPENWISL